MTIFPEILDKSANFRYNSYIIHIHGGVVMKKADLIQAVAEKTGKSKKEAGVFVDAVLESIQDALVAGDKVTLTGFGVFEVRERAAKKCRSPRTGEMLEVEACKAPAFKAGKNLKEAVNK